MTTVDLRTLVPNPFRDLKVDPILHDPAIQASIERHKFWGGTVVRRTKDELQIAAGHVRVNEAINCGITHADLFVSDNISDDDMVRIYATENATQRGVENNAIAGSVIAAVRLILRRQIYIDFANGNNGLDTEENRTVEINSANLGGQRREGVGRDAVFDELGDIPGYTENMIRQQLNLLKLSGDYDRIVNEEIDKAEAEHAARIAALEKQLKQQADKAERQRMERELAAEREAAEAVEAAKLATDNAAQKRIDTHGTADPLDLAGISKYLTNPHHVETFRKLVLSESVKNLLPKESQAALAEALANKATETGVELTGAFIWENFYGLVTQVRATSRKNERDFTRLDWDSKVRKAMDNFARSCRGMVLAGTELAELNKSRPRGTTIHATGEFASAVRNIQVVIKRLEDEKVIKRFEEDK